MSEVKNVNTNPEGTITTMVERDIKKVTARQKVVKVISQTIIYIFLLIIALVVLFPF